MLTQDRLKSIFDYDPVSGVFTRRVARGRPSNGHRPNCNGYIIVMVEGKRYYAHRLAFLYMTGAFPPDGMEVDHINMDRADNAWGNLRLATHAENQLNKSVTKASVSGVKGVCWDSRNRRWVAYTNGAQKSFPRDKKNEAIEWVRRTRAVRDGEFSRD